MAYENPLDQLIHDCTHAHQSGINDLAMWSALYYRHIYVVEIPVEHLTAASGFSERQFRRLVSQGIDKLAQELRRREHQLTMK